MVAVPTIRTWKDAPDPESILTYKEYGESIFDVLDFMMNPPMVHLTNTTQIGWLNNTFMNISWERIIIDTHGAFNPATSSVLIKAPVAGWYKGWYGVGYAAAGTGATGVRTMALITQSPVVTEHWNQVRASIDTVNNYVVKGVRFYVPLTAAQSVQMQVYQNSGATINSEVANIEGQSEFFMRWWKPL